MTIHFFPSDFRFVQDPSQAAAGNGHTYQFVFQNLKGHKTYSLAVRFFQEGQAWRDDETLCKEFYAPITLGQFPVYIQKESASLFLEKVKQSFNLGTSPLDVLSALKEVAEQNRRIHSLEDLMQKPALVLPASRQRFPYLSVRDAEALDTFLTSHKKFVQQELAKGIETPPTLYCKKEHNALFLREPEALLPPLPRTVEYTKERHYLIHLNSSSSEGICDPLIGRGAYKKAKYTVDLNTGTVYADLITENFNKEDRYSIDLVLNEFNIQKEFTGVEGIAQVYSYRIFSGKRGREKLSMRMRYYPGGDLHSYLSNTTPREERKQLALSFLKGVCTIHRKGYVHYDLKPGNILIDNGAFITDFTLAKRIGEKAPLYGTPTFSAPELSSSLYNFYSKQPEIIQEASPKADVWSAGVVLALLLEMRFDVSSKGRKHCFYPGRFFWNNNVKDALDFLRNLWRERSETSADHWLGPEERGGAPTERNLIRAMLHVDPQKRISSDDALLLAQQLF